MRALDATWKTNPASFLDLDKVLADLSNRPKAELLKLIGKMVMMAPESLTACGYRGLENQAALRTNCRV